LVGTFNDILVSIRCNVIDNTSLWMEVPNNRFFC